MSVNLYAAILVLLSGSASATNRTDSLSHVACRTNSRLSHMNCSGGFPDFLPDYVTYLGVGDVRIPSLGYSHHHFSPVFVSSRKLEFLVIRNCQVASIQPAVFENVPNLRVLDLSLNSLTSLPDYSFEPLPLLRNLNLRNNQIKFLSVGTFSHLRYLEKLDLSGNNLTEFQALLPPALTHLRLTNNKLHTIVTPLRLPRLETLELCQNLLRSVEPFKVLEKLKSLCVGDLNLSIEDKVTQVISWPSLERLTLRGYSISAPPLPSDFSLMLGSLVHLKELAISDYALTRLDFLPLLRNCTSIQLHRVVVSEPLPHDCFLSAVDLDLSGSQQLVREVTNHLATLASMKNVQKLTMKTSDLMTLDWVPRLSRFSNLKVLDITGNIIDCNDTLTKNLICDEVGKPSTIFVGLRDLKCSSSTSAKSALEHMCHLNMTYGGNFNTPVTLMPAMRTTAGVSTIVVAPKANVVYWVVVGTLGGLVLILLAVLIVKCWKERRIEVRERLLP